MRRKLFLRADANSQIGMGHVYRLLALAEILNDDFESTFITNNPGPFLLNEIKKKCSYSVVLNYRHQYRKPDEVSPREEIDFDMQEFLTGDEIVVTDGYLFGSNYQLAIKASGAGLVCIDDLATNEFYADIVINHAPGLDESIYEMQPYTRLLTGLDYAILRKPFFKPIKEKTQGDRSKAFISVGGTDFYGYTEKLVGLLQSLKYFESIHVLCSSSFSIQLLERLERIQRNSGDVSLHFNLGADEILTVLDECTHAFVSASTVLMESYSRGLKCFAGYYTNNQVNIYAGFIRLKLAGNIGNLGEINDKVIADALGGQQSIRSLSAPFLSDRNIRRAFCAIA